MQPQKALTCISCGKLLSDGEFFCSRCRATVGDFTPTYTGQAPTQDALLGYILENRYRLEAEIGRGGMGTVYRATRLHIGDEVAVKILHPGQVADTHMAERFRREAQAAARLKHPNAVNVYDFGVDKTGLFYLVTELAVGQSLRELINERKTLPAALAVEIVAQVCAALDEAHARQIVHRDIKPDNIIVNHSLVGWRVKVLDFGIAKLRDQGMENITQTNNVMGTPHYMSPEQCLGEELDARSDVYSVGVVLYEMLCGSVPFDSPISTAVVIQHVNQTPPSLCAINVSIPPAVEALVMRALAKRREARPQSAGAFAQQLLAAVREESFVQTPPPSHAAPTIAFAPSSGAVDTPGYMPTVVLPAAARSQSDNGSPQPAKSSFSAPLLFFSILLAVAAGSIFTYYFIQGGKTDAPDTSQDAAAKERPSASKPAPVAVPATQTSTNMAQPPPVPVKRPAGAIRFAYCLYIGVNLRVLPARDSILVTTIGKNQGVWVLEESNNTDTVTIRSEGREVTDNWSRVELADAPTVQGWVFNGFLSKE